MHIPDGFLDTKTWVGLTAVSGAAVAVAAATLKRSAAERQVPLMGVMAAFVFAAQMLNFPVAAGTSGHFMGGVLVAVMLGPLAGILIMTCVLAVQCLVFQDGGVTALGANVLNMGIIGSFSGYYLYRCSFAVLNRLVNRRRAFLTAAAAAAWASIVLAAAAAAVELAVSGTVPMKIALPAMAGVHAVIGIGEGIITLLALGFILKVRPDLLPPDGGGR